MSKNAILTERNKAIRDRYLELRGQRIKKDEALKTVVDEYAKKQIKLSTFTVSNIVSFHGYSNSPIAPLVKEAS